MLNLHSYPTKLSYLSIHIIPSYDTLGDGLLLLLLDLAHHITLCILYYYISTQYIYMI